MNDRYIDLAVEALVEHIACENWVFSDSELKRFADLIIGECLEVCKSRVGNSDYNTGRMHCASDIKEHFGVKE